MKDILRVLFVILCVGFLVGCQTARSDDNLYAPDKDDVETWARQPFYGEIRFLVVSEATSEPIADATLQVSGLSIEALSNASDQDGWIVIRQFERGITYRGKEPPPPSFTFSAPGYRSRTYLVEDLISGTVYDPYSSDNLPTTTIENEVGAEIELPIYEFTVRLQPGD